MALKKKKKEVPNRQVAEEEIIEEPEEVEEIEDQIKELETGEVEEPKQIDARLIYLTEGETLRHILSVLENINLRLAIIEKECLDS